MALNVVTRGYGPSASVALIVTRGYSIGEPPQRNVSIMGTTQLTPTVNQVWVTYAENDGLKR